MKVTRVSVAPEKYEPSAMQSWNDWSSAIMSMLSALFFIKIDIDTSDPFGTWSQQEYERKTKLSFSLSVQSALATLLLGDQESGGVECNTEHRDHDHRYFDQLQEAVEHKVAVLGKDAFSMVGR